MRPEVAGTLAAMPPVGPGPHATPGEPATPCTAPWPLVAGSGELDDLAEGVDAYEAMLASCVPRPERWLEEHPAEAIARLVQLGALEHAATAHRVDLPLGDHVQEIGPIYLGYSNGAPHHCGDRCRPLFRAMPDIRPTTQETPS